MYTVYPRFLSSQVLKLEGSQLISKHNCSPKNIKIILAGRATCRLHRKSPIEYKKKLL